MQSLSHFGKTLEALDDEVFGSLCHYCFQEPDIAMAEGEGEGVERDKSISLYHSPLSPTL